MINNPFTPRTRPDWSEYENDPRYRLIPLTQGCSTLVDADDYPELSKYKWCAAWNAHTQSFYVARNIRKADGSRMLLRMHTAITDYQVTDHKNGDTLDNRRENLRSASSSQNAYNKTLRSDNTSGFQCVSLYKNINKWYAYIDVNYKRKYLGYYNDPIQAAQAYDNAARELRGEFACLNFPNPGERSAITGEICK
jgi:hypothetical protein